MNSGFLVVYMMAGFGLSFGYFHYEKALRADLNQWLIDTANNQLELENLAVSTTAKEGFLNQPDEVDSEDVPYDTKVMSLDVMGMPMLDYSTQIPSQ